MPRRVLGTLPDLPYLKYHPWRPHRFGVHTDLRSKGRYWMAVRGTMMIPRRQRQCFPRKRLNLEGKTKGAEEPMDSVGV